MSEETTNKQDMPEQLSDILLVLDKEKMKIIFKQNHLLVKLRVIHNFIMIRLIVYFLF